jgi:hypothetical protein
MRSARLLAAALLFCILLQSQPPSPTPGKTAQYNQRKARGKQSEESGNHEAADKISSAINKLTAEVASWKQQSSSAPQKNEAPADWWLKWSTIISAAATLCIAVLAFFQWRAMRGHKEALDAMAVYMRDGLKETKKAADAATKSADTAERALKLTQRADVLLSGVSLRDSAGVDASPVRPDSYVILEFKNFGRTRAENVVFEIMLVIPDCPSSVKHLGPMVLGAGDTQALRFQAFGEFLTELIASGIGDGTIKLSFTGKVSYRDIFDVVHTTSPSGVFHSKMRYFVTEQNRED